MTKYSLAKTPSLSFNDLMRVVPETNGVRKTIARNTTVELVSHPRGMVIRHHGNAIALLGDEGFTLENSGWDSSSTAQRLNRILLDNAPSTPYRIGIRQGITSLISALGYAPLRVTTLSYDGDVIA